MGGPEPESLRDRRFVSRSLRGSRFVGCDLGDVVVRGSDVSGMQLDSPWLGEGGATLLVNGIDVVPFVDAQLDAAFPGRELRTAATPDGLRAAWAALEQTWAVTTAWATSLPGSLLDASVDGEWSLAQTLRHLVMATDTWLGKAILRQEQPYHPVGLPNDDDEGTAAYDRSVFAVETPEFAEVLAARAERQDLVRAFLAGVTPAQLREARSNPHEPTYEETVLSCVRTILDEEWEHHRYAVRDLRTLAGAEAGSEAGGEAGRGAGRGAGREAERGSTGS